MLPLALWRWVGGGWRACDAACAMPLSRFLVAGWRWEAGLPSPSKGSALLGVVVGLAGGCEGGSSLLAHCWTRLWLRVGLSSCWLGALVEDSGWGSPRAAAACFGRRHGGVSPSCCCPCGCSADRLQVPVALAGFLGKHMYLFLKKDPARLHEDVLQEGEAKHTYGSAVGRQLGGGLVPMRASCRKVRPTAGVGLVPMRACCRKVRGQQLGVRAGGGVHQGFGGWGRSYEDVLQEDERSCAAAQPAPGPLGSCSQQGCFSCCPQCAA